MATRWKAVDDGGSFGVFTADSTSDLEEQVEDWVRDGEWGDEGALVSIYCTSEDGENHAVNVEIEPNEAGMDPNAWHHDREGHTHNWESPGFLGGCSENPGVWSEGNELHCRVACQCGAVKSHVLRKHAPAYEGKPREEITQIVYEYGLWPDGQAEECPAWFKGLPPA